jgi:GntR family transcriptional regulator, transcriptional repressor for pyruvate dehydrogenase complex
MVKMSVLFLIATRVISRADEARPWLCLWSLMVGNGGNTMRKGQKAQLKKPPTRVRKGKKSVARSRSPQAESTSVANMLAGQLHDAIVGGEFVVGSSLPSERELMNKYQVSRTTVREALRDLSAQELIQVKRGRKGGSFISSPTSHSLIRSLTQFIKGQDIRFIDLVFVREAIEPAAAAQAAVSRTEEKLHALWLMCVECERNVFEADRFVEANLKWHLTLAEASNNPLFVAFLTSISTALHAATAFEEFDLRIRKAVVGVHWQIYNAIRVGDPDAARRRMERHLSAYGQQLASINLAGKSAEAQLPGPETATQSE